MARLNKDRLGEFTRYSRPICSQVERLPSARRWADAGKIQPGCGQGQAAVWQHLGVKRSFPVMKSAAAAGVFVLLLLAGGCVPDAADESRAAGGSDDPSVSGDTTALTETEYVTSLLFLPLEPSQTRAISLHLSNTANADGLTQRYLAWELDRSGWRAVLDAESQAGTTRAPWRIFPADSLRLTVSPDGDAEDLILRVRSADHTLDLGNALDRWEDRYGTQHEIRTADWGRQGQEVTGLAVQHRFALAEPPRPARFGAYLRAVLRSDEGAIIVIFHTPEPEVYGSPYAWMYADGLTQRWTVVDTRAAEVANSAQLRRNVPIRIAFSIPEPNINGELTAAERQFSELPAEAGPKSYKGLYRVRGWIEFAGERHTVEGMLELGEP